MPNWAGPLTPDPGPDPGPRGVSGRLGANDVGSRRYGRCLRDFFVARLDSRNFPLKTLQNTSLRVRGCGIPLQADGGSEAADVVLSIPLGHAVHPSKSATTAASALLILACRQADVHCDVVLHSGGTG